MRSKSILFFLFLFALQLCQAQGPKQATSAEIYHAIQKLNVLGSALYIAAHPDDENTRLISYLSNEKKVRTAYLSLTRGDGGQNLIGPEMRELLGLIRTQELLQARSIDGGEQMFSRANDFGYSKTPEETLNIWNKDEVLSDVVWAIRKYKPDVIINRFSHDSGRRTHGHHTASAMLSVEAFDMIGDKNISPNQLDFVDVWTPQRLFFNTSWWFYGSRENFKKADKSRMVSVDVGVYYPVLGRSNNEIAADSRSMHKCQGDGSTTSRGTHIEYLEVLKGDMPKDKHDIFEGINTTWTRLEGGAPIGILLSEVEDEFKLDKPGASLPKLIQALELMKRLDESSWKEIKQKEIKQVISWCMGLFAEVVTNDQSASPGDSIGISIEFVNRTFAEVILESISIPEAGFELKVHKNLDINEQFDLNKTLKLSDNLKYTSPYWLQEPWEIGMYTVNDQLSRGLPETPRMLKMEYVLTVNDVQISYSTEVVYKETDPVKGEVYYPFELVPPVSVKIDESVYVFGNSKSKPVSAVISAHSPNLMGSVGLDVPEGWEVEPNYHLFEMAEKGSEKRFVFDVTPPENQSEESVEAVVRVGMNEYRFEAVEVAYDHIPHQTVLRPSRSKIVKIDLSKEGNNIGFIKGAGDEIPASLRQIGYDVIEMEPESVNGDALERFDAVIIGIRAYNTKESLKWVNEYLMEYIRKGGTLITQYNKDSRLKTDVLGPYPLHLSRDRVTNEKAPVVFLEPDHEILNYPNQITQKDFEGWVQERGLYFPDQWDEAYIPILSSHDPGEKPLKGSLLVAKYGEGYHIYTGLSWFRQLPAGVPGAYRLFTNLVSIGKKSRP